MAGAAAALTATEQYRKALEAAEGIRLAALDEIRGRLDGQIAELNSFGYDYRLVRAGAVQKQRAVSARPRRCVICNMEGHDARVHRGQAVKKKFTKTELEEKGLAV